MRWLSDDLTANIHVSLPKALSHNFVRAISFLSFHHSYFFNVRSSFSLQKTDRQTKSYELALASLQ